jgi:hypothetical protein
MTQTLNHQLTTFSLKPTQVQSRVTRDISGLQIQDIVQQALTTGYLSVEAENQLRQLLQCKLNANDLRAFWILQNAAMTGCVKQESRELQSLTETN